MTILKPLWTMPKAKTRNSCPYCRGSGYEFITEAHPEMYGNDKGLPEFAVPCRICQGKRKNFERESRLRIDLPYFSNISAFNPSAYKDNDGNIIDFMPQYNFITKYCEKYKEVEDELEIRGLYIYSRTAGNGKTFLASCICTELYLRHQLIPIYVLEANLLDRLKAVVSDAQISPRRQLMEAPVLFIDDMWSKESGREWLNDELFTIIDYRYTRNLPTIITSNIPLDSPKIDRRIASRIDEMCAPIKLPDVEIRSKEKIQKRKKMFDAFNKETNNED